MVNGCQFARAGARTCLNTLLSDELLRNVMVWGAIRCHTCCGKPSRRRGIHRHSVLSILTPAQCTAGHCCHDCTIQHGTLTHTHKYIEYMMGFSLSFSPTSCLLR